MNTALLPPPAPAPAQPPLLERTVAFGDADRCVAEVRAGARAFLTPAHLPRPLREDALVVNSEVVTNTVRHTHAPGSLHLAHGPAGLDVPLVEAIPPIRSPHRAETFKLSGAPLFVDKVRDVVGLYLDPPERVLCCAWTRSHRSGHWTARSRCCR